MQACSPIQTQRCVFGIKHRGKNSSARIEKDVSSDRTTPEGTESMSNAAQSH